MATRMRKRPPPYVGMGSRMVNPALQLSLKVPEVTRGCSLFYGVLNRLMAVLHLGCCVRLFVDLSVLAFKHMTGLSWALKLSHHGDFTIAN